MLYSILDAIVIPGPLLWLGACLGHGYWLTVSLNWLYGFKIHHRILDNTRTLVMLAALAGPFLFLDGLRFPPEFRLTGEGLTWASVRPLYSAYCCLFGFMVAPIAQLCYWLRRPAPQVMRRDSEVLDMAKKLGFPPRGSGPEAASTRLPFNQAFEVEFVELHLRLPRLPPEWDGLSILHLTDLHFHKGMDRSFYQCVIDRCLAWETPDLVCVTGDIVDSMWHHRWIVPLLGKLRWKDAGLFLLGNHDAWWEPRLIRRRMCRLGFLDVGNTTKQLEIRGRPLHVMGNEGPWIGQVPRPQPGPPDVFSLCLSHSPDAIRWARRCQADLMLAGHVHGGQIRLPLIGSLFVPSRFSRRFDCGTFYEAPTVMHVGRGLAGKHLLRIRCRPEVTRLVLHPAAV